MMETGQGFDVGDGGHRGVAPESEALLNVLRPYCMAAMMAMENLLRPGENLASAPPPPPPAAAGIIPDRGPQLSPSPSSSTDVAVKIAAGRRLEASLASLLSALCALVNSLVISSPGSPSSASSSPPSLAASGAVRRAFPAVLPFVMLPLELALFPLDGRNPEGGGRGGGRNMGGVAGGARPEVPAGAKEQAFLCVAEAVRGSGARFVEGYGVKRTIHMLVRLVITLSECSPMSGGLPVDVARATVGGGRGGAGGSGLTAGTDALRLACLKCLEAIFRAPLTPEDHSGNSRGSSSSSINNNNGLSWSEVRDYLKACLGCKLLAQLVQELLWCCQQQGVDSNASTDATASNGASADSGVVALSTSGGGAGGARVWGGPEEARAAAGTLDALCSFVPGAAVWRPLLPGTVGGLFRTIRGIGEGSDGGGGEERDAVLPLGFISMAVSQTAPYASGGSGGERRRGGSKSALVELCLGTLAKLLLMCAGREAATAAGARASPGNDTLRVTENGGGRGLAAEGVASGNSKNVSSSSDGNPLLALQRLAYASNAPFRNLGPPGQSVGTVSAAAPPGECHESDRLNPAPPAQTGNFPTASAAASAAAAAAAAAVIAVENPEWETLTSDRLRLLLPPLLAFCCMHPGWRVRRATAKLAADLLRAGGGGCGGGGGEKEAAATNGREHGGGGRGGSHAVKQGLLAPLAPLLMEALVGLLLDGMPQVSAEARRGLDSFRANLAPFRWLELRSTLLERLCAIAEGLPALAKSADEKRVRAAFDLLAGYLSLLRFDARAALDGRLSSVLSCLCEALEFDEDFNVQVLEGASGRCSSSSRGGENNTARDTGHDCDGGRQQECHPNYYRQVFVNVREDSTLSSARRAVRLLGKFCDLPSIADASISSLEARPPRPPPPPSQRHRHRSSPLSPAAATSGTAVSDPSCAPGSRGDGSDGVNANDAVYRRRCLKWLRLRLPLAWVLNQALLGRVPSSGAGSDAGEGVGNGGGGNAAGTGEGKVMGEKENRFLGRGLAMSMLERLLASHAFALPVSRAEAAAAGYAGSYGSTSSGSIGLEGKSLLASGRVTGLGAGGGGGGGAIAPRAVEYTRSGEVLGAGGGGGARSRSLGFSGQVLNANATLVSTVAEALGSLAEACGPDCGEAFLRRALYPVLEKAASTHPVVSQAALATLSRMRLACGDFQDTAQLLEANMDYVVDDVIRRVSSCTSRMHRGLGGGSAMTALGGTGAVSGIPSVVEAVLRIGGSAMGPALVRDLAGVTLREVDACAWDPRQSRRSLGVLRAVASCVTLPPPSTPENSAKVPAAAAATATSLARNRHERDKKGNTREGLGGQRSEGGGASELAESPWFRQLFVEFADAADIRRVEEASSTKGEGARGAPGTLLQAVREHREAMGFDIPDDASDNDRLENHPEKIKEAWREVHEEAGKASEETEEALPEPDAEGRKMAESEEVKTLSEVLARSCHFLATPSLETQALALACMRDCVRKLASAGADAALLPHVHRAWRPLMASLREHLTPLTFYSSAGSGGDETLRCWDVSSLPSRRAVLLHALDTVDALVDVCGDFLSSKVSEDLWPLLKLLLLQYADSRTARGGGASTTGSRRQQRSTLFSSSSPSPQPAPSLEGLLLNGGESSGRADEIGIGDGVGGGAGGPSSLLLVPLGGPTRGADDGDGRTGAAVGLASTSGGGGVRAGQRGGTMGEKVVARALESLEGLCSSPQCERFMTPLAREVALAALPCLSCAAEVAIRSRAEALFRRLAFLDGDSLWLLLVQTLDTAAQQQHPQQQRESQLRHERQQQHAALVGGEPALTGERRRDRGRVARTWVAPPTAAAARPTSVGLGALTSGGDAGAATSRDVDEGMCWWLPTCPSLQPSVLAGQSVVGGRLRGRPTALLERKSLFGGEAGRVARECAPAVARILGVSSAHGTAVEHM